MWNWALEHPYLFTLLFMGSVFFGPRELIQTVASVVRALRAPLPGSEP